MKNFVVTYEQRVGSSALVDSLANLGSFKIPVFEELDSYYIDNTGQSERWTVDTIHNLVAETFENALAASHGCGVGFKWRIWGRPERVCEVLRKYDVTMFNMVRSNWLDFVASIYMTDVVYSDSNAPQFILDTLSKDERDNLLKRYRENTVEVDIPAFMDLSARLYWKEMNRIEYLQQLQAAGIPIYTIYYEDFAYKNLHFMSKLVEVLGGEPLQRLPESCFKKVSSPYPSEAFTNRKELLAVPGLIDTILKWETVVHDGSIKPLPM